MSLKKLKSKLFRKNIAISLTSVLVAISILLLIQLYQIPITYSDNLFTIEEAEDGVVDITFENSDYYCAHGMEREIIKDGIAINIQYIYFTDTIWTKFFTRGKPDEPSQFSIGQSISEDYEGEGKTIEFDGQVDYIYYLIGDYKKINLTDEEYVALAEDAVLLWSRDKDGKKD